LRTDKGLLEVASKPEYQLHLRRELQLTERLYDRPDISVRIVDGEQTLKFTP